MKTDEGAGKGDAQSMVIKGEENTILLRRSREDLWNRTGNRKPQKWQLTDSYSQHICIKLLTVATTLETPLLFAIDLISKCLHVYFRQRTPL